MAHTETDEISDTEGSSKDGSVGSPQGAAAPGSGLSGLTTVMIRNIPFRYSQHRLKQELGRAGFDGTYDFFYMPVAVRSKSNRGFAFINFLTPEMAEQFYGKYQGQLLCDFQEPSTQPLAICAAHMQGFEESTRYACKHQQSLRGPVLLPELHHAQSPQPVEPESPQEIARTKLRVKAQPWSPWNNSPWNNSPCWSSQSFSPPEVPEPAQQFCAFCGGQLPATGRFCPYCGRQHGAHR